MSSWKDILPEILGADPVVAEAVQRRLDLKTKPRGSLGRLETLAVRFASIVGRTDPAIPRKTIVVMGADHGVVEEGTSAYPAEVTAQMLLNFAAGGAAINVLGRQVGAEVVVVDMGVGTALPPHPQIVTRRIGAGTRNFTREPAMSEAQASAAIDAGIDIVRERAEAGMGLIGIGEMGIGNTTAASALASVLCDVAPHVVTGRGTGVDDAGLARKVDAIARGIALHRPDARRPLEVLAQLGGFEIAGLCGVVLGAAVRRIPVVLDGWIATVAALVATRLAPEAGEVLIASHRSVEPGHRLVLDAMGCSPLFDLDLRLGEGTGAALAMPWIDGALAILAEMATFESAGVSDSGA